MSFLQCILLTLCWFTLLTVTVRGSTQCDFICFNQTEMHSMTSPILLDDTANDDLILFYLNCSDLTDVTLVNLSISIDNPRSIEIKDQFPLNFAPLSNQSSNITFNLTVQGRFLGYSQLSLHVQYLNETKSILNLTNDLQIEFAVKRKSTVLDTIFTVIIVILVCIGTFLIGCRLSTLNFYANLRRPIPILIGLFSQFLCLPLFAFCLAKLAKFDSSTALGLLATGSAPGGGASNMYTAMFAGDVDLSASMTFTSTILAFATFPLWILLLGREFINTRNVHFPWENMLTTLMSLVIPAGIGLVLRWKKAHLADRCTKFLRLLTLIFIVYILTFGIYSNIYIFKLINYRTFLVSASLPYVGFLIGLCMSLITRQTRQRLIAIFIESGLQNTGVAIIFLRLSLPQPDSDLAIVVPIFVALAIPIPLLILYTIMTIHQRYAQKSTSNSLITNIDTEHDQTQYERLPTSDFDD